MNHLRVRLLVVLVGAVAVSAVLLGAAPATTAPPPVDGWVGVEAWYEEVGAAPAAIALLRLATLAVAAWLGLASALQLLATLSARPAVAWLADAASPRAVRRLVPRAAGLSLSLALVGPPAPTDPAGTAVMEVLDAESAAPAPAPTEPAPAPTAPAPAPPPAPTVPAPASPPPAGEGDEVVVAPGDSFWSLAVDAVTGHAPPVAVDGYWRRLIEANRSRLVDPANPDLLYPGQVLRLPPPIA